MNITRRQFGTLTVGALVAVALKPLQAASSSIRFFSLTTTLPQGIYKGTIMEYYVIGGFSSRLHFTIGEVQ